MGEVDDPHDAEDQAEPDAHQAVDGADQKARGECLQKSFHQPRPRAAYVRGCCRRLLSADDARLVSRSTMFPPYYVALLMMPIVKLVLARPAGTALRWRRHCRVVRNRR